MPVITAIRRNKKNGGRCSIFVDDVFFAACPIDVAVGMGLRKGLEMSPELEQRLRSEDRRMVLRQKAWRFVTYKPRTERQVHDALRKQDWTDEEIEDVLLWLREFRAVDDVAYAERFILASLERKPLSPPAMRAALLTKGIPELVVADVLERFDVDVVDNARRVAEKKLRSMTSDNPDKRMQSLIRFLQYRRYDWDTIRNVIDHCKSTGLLLVLCGVLCQQLAQSQVLNCPKVRLPERINRFQPTTLPVVSPDGRFLYLDRKYHPDNIDGSSDPDDVWTCERLPNGQWSEPQRKTLVESSLRQPDIVFNFTSNGLTALVAGRYDVRGSDTMMTLALLHRGTGSELFSNVEVLQFDRPIVLGKNFYAHVAEDRNTLILSAQLSDSRGDLDLYVSRRCGSVWTFPVTLGDGINTSLFDGAPWLGADGKTLYYSSAGRNTRLGKADLYVSRRLDDTWQKWSAPRSLGSCINTVDDETCISLTPSADTAYISSWDAETGRTGVYSVELSPELRPENHVRLSGMVVDAVTNSVLSTANICIVDTSRSGQCDTTKVTVDANGSYTLVLPSHSTYRVITQSPFYVTHRQLVGVHTLDSVTPVRLAVRLFDTRRPLASVFFERASAEVSREMLDTLVQLVRRYDVRNIDMDIVGYTDKLGTVPYNTTLSSQRAQSVKRELIKIGLDEERIRDIGRGIDTVLPSGTTEHPESRRVDIFPASRHNER